jgi:hypothetical protein
MRSPRFKSIFLRAQTEGIRAAAEAQKEVPTVAI